VQKKRKEKPTAKTTRTVLLIGLSLFKTTLLVLVRVVVLQAH